MRLCFFPGANSPWGWCRPRALGLWFSPLLLALVFSAFAFVSTGAQAASDMAASVRCSVREQADNQVYCVAVCVNQGPDPAIAAVCGFAGVAPPTVTYNSCPEREVLLKSGRSISCGMHFLQPQGATQMQASTAALNDGNEANNATDVPVEGSSPLAMQSTLLPMMPWWLLAGLIAAFARMVALRHPRLPA